MEQRVHGRGSEIPPLPGGYPQLIHRLSSAVRAASGASCFPGRPEVWKGLAMFGLEMFGAAMIGSLVPATFAIAGCASALVLGSSLRRALPLVRGIVADSRSIAEDRVWLITMIETPRHQAGTPPRPELAGATITRPEPAFATATRSGAVINRPLRPVAAPAWREAA